jgi:hypothetical protein
VFPDVNVRDARQLRDDARQLLAGGVDPSEVRRMERVAQREEQERSRPATRFMLDSNGALSFTMGTCRLDLTAAETAELRTFPDATRGVIPKG